MRTVSELTPTEKAARVLSGELLPVAEIFGPTIQGEGRWAGTPCYFIRFGGCDYRCKWCDSMHAVDEAYQDTWEYLTPEEILQRVADLKGGFDHVVLSGGNPAIHNLHPLLRVFDEDWGPRKRRWMFSLETQGTIISPWFWKMDHLTVSPKPPSSGMRQSKTVIDRFFMQVTAPGLMIGTTLDLKIVVFDQTDIEWAREIITHVPLPRDTRYFLSVGTNAMDSKVDNMQRYREIIGQVLDTFPPHPQVSIMPQMHVLLWGHRKGV